MSKQRLYDFLCWVGRVIPVTALLLSAFIAVLPAHFAVAQAEGSMDEIENLFTKDEDVSDTNAPGATQTPSQAKAPESPLKVQEFKDVSDLGKLQSFKDIAVIQKRYMPKSQRWEVYLAPTINLNDAFFLSFGGSLRFGYYFRERYGLEGIATMLTVSERQVIQDLRDKRHVNTTSFVTPRGYYGLALKWAPVYGKMTWINKKITPFDLYFSGGLGLTGTNQNTNEATLHLGTGQIFALSKSSAIRWDFSWYMFTSASSADKSGSRALYHNLLFTIGWSGFFPEAKYR
jgi:outer membrane beta-barrel protein